MIEITAVPSFAQIRDVGGKHRGNMLREMKERSDPRVQGKETLAGPSNVVG